MLSSLNLGSIDNLEKLPINSLNSICERVRLALLHVYLPKLCEKCQPAFSETFKKTQSNPLLLKVLCDPCKLNYIRDKRSVSRKKAKPVKSSEPRNPPALDENGGSLSKNPAKRKQKSETSRNAVNKIENTNKTFINLKLKIKLLSATSSIPFSPPKSSEISLLSPPNSDDEVTVLIDNSGSSSGKKDGNNFIEIIDKNCDNMQSTESISIPDKQIYEILSEKSVDWCRYCGAAGETGTFWKLGPWGDRTLCHKHGCEFFGCGFARVTRTRLDLTKFYGEKRVERKQPIISDFCAICWSEKDECGENFLNCHSCPLGFHKACLKEQNHFKAFSENCEFYFCSSNCSQNFECLTIRPQFPSKSVFPFYRQILTLDDSEKNPKNVFDPLSFTSRPETPLPSSSKLLLNLKRPNSAEPQIIGAKKRKYHRKMRHNDNQFDRVIAFLPVKVDQTIHQHEIIHTPQWTKKSLQERLSVLESTCAEFEPSFEPLEELNEQKLLQRHARYEHIEKTTRLLKPGVLQQLVAGEI